jgi:hypothetical protein
VAQLLAFYALIGLADSIYSSDQPRVLRAGVVMAIVLLLLLWGRGSSYPRPGRSGSCRELAGRGSPSATFQQNKTGFLGVGFHLGAGVTRTTVGCGWLLVGGAGGEKLQPPTMLRISRIAKMPMMICARRCER